MKKFLMFLGLITMISSAGMCFAANALFDEGHGQYWPMSSDGLFEAARTAITGAGHTISTHTGLITFEAMAGFDIFVTGTLNSSLTTTEIEALSQFVTAGGIVFVNHDGGWSSDSATSSVNSFLAPYGVVLASYSSYTGGLLVEGYSTHCLTEGVSSLGLDYVRLITSISSPAVDLTTGSIDILAVFENENGGKVIVLPDDSLWGYSDEPSDYSITDLDNLTMLLNIFNCMTGSVSTDAQTWGGLKSLYR